MPTSIIGDRFQQVCRDLSDSVAVRNLATGATTTFAELSSECAAIERALADLGIGRGEAVVSLVGNSPIFFSIVVACMEAGAALVPLGQATDAEALALIGQAGAVAVFTDR